MCLGAPEFRRVVLPIRAGWGRRGCRWSCMSATALRVGCVALVQSTVLFAVLDDTRTLIQSLRQELSPFVGDVDVVLGGSFLSHFEVDLDYPSRRVVLQRAEGQAAGACAVRG